MWGKSFAELQDGDRVDCVVAILKAEVGTSKNGSSYLKLNVSDASGVSLSAKRWQATQAEVEAVQQGSYPLWGRIVGNVDTYDNVREVKTNQEICGVAEPMNAYEYLPSSAMAITELRARLRWYIYSIHQPQLKALLETVFIKDKILADKFETMPAAKIHHHAFRHGLIQHTLEVADIVDAICSKQQNWGPGKGRLSRDLAVTGALLHDIGKVEEFAPDCHGISYSAGGNLLGHVTLGVVRVGYKIGQIRKEVNFSKELAEIVLHIIASHHGKGEFGAPVPPKIAEASLVHYADMLSTECFYFAEAEHSAPSGAIDFLQKKLDMRRVFVGDIDGLWSDNAIQQNVILPKDYAWSPETTGNIPIVMSTPEPDECFTIPTRPSLPLLRRADSESKNNFVTVSMSLVGKAAGGQPILDTANIEEEIEIEAEGLMLGRGSYYALRIQGDSMVGDGINDGDLVVVRHQDQAEWGDIIVACLEDGATVKRLTNRNGSIVLMPSNPEHLPIIVADPDSLSIQGRVVAVVR